MSETLTRGGVADIREGRREMIERRREAFVRDGGAALGFGRDFAATGEAVRRASACRAVERISLARRGGMAGCKLRRAIEFISGNLEGDLSLATIAAEVGMNRFHFTRAFKQETGFAPHAYVTRRRVERAKELLAATDLTVSAVAVRTGFASQSHFTRRFRHVTGITPALYRALVNRG